MNISYKGIHVEVGEELKEYATKRLLDCARLLHDNGVSAVCDVDFSKDHAQGKGAVNKVAVTLESHGKVYRAEAVMETFEASIDKVKDELWDELRKNKEKHADAVRKGGAKGKEMMRGE